jgi:hypothetical protein
VSGGGGWGMGLGDGDGGWAGVGGWVGWGCGGWGWGGIPPAGGSAIICSGSATHMQRLSHHHRGAALVLGRWPCSTSAGLIHREIDRYIKGNR